jgi:guanylate kinase
METNKKSKGEHGMIYLIVGRTGSGKNHLAKLLEQRGLKEVKSYSSRPKRYDGEDGHIFISPEEVDQYEEKAAYTKIGDYEYFTTMKQINESDVYIIDPNGIKELVKNMPETTFHIVYVYADEMSRKLHAVNRADNKLKEEDVFNKRNKAEDEQFTEFEKTFGRLPEEDNPFMAENITCCYKYDNTYDEDNAEMYAEFLAGRRIHHNRMTGIVEEAAALGIMEKSETDPEKVKVSVSDENGNESIRTVTKEHFADSLLNNPESMAMLMRIYVMESDRFNDLSELQK